jgi:hypothetical protein
MIKLERDRAAAPKSFGGVTRVKRALELITAQQAATQKFKQNYWKAAKSRLKAEAHGKCAYCEAATDVVAHGDVEHFRPKSVYWWLAYSYDNYLYSCQICNQTYKADAFPVTGVRLRPPVLSGRMTPARLQRIAASLTPDPHDDTAGLPFRTFSVACTRERALLPDPYLEDPERFFAWEADAVLKEVRLKAATTRYRKRFEAAETYFGLNRDELKRWRWHTYRQLKTLADAFEQDVAPAMRDELAESLSTFMAADAQFAGMARYFVRRVWRLNV